MTNEELKRSVSRLKEMQQFGVGETFPDRMKALRHNEALIREALPFVSFGEDDSIKCWPFPVPDGAGFDMFLLITDGITSFPTNEKHKYIYKNTLQTLFIINGNATIVTPHRKIRLTAGEIKEIEPGTPVRVTYKNCIILFKISPRVDFNDFFFE